jgi:flavin reductase (DIM6/NTAB) family NADH-FMN oxidoreductase RutF
VEPFDVGLLEAFSIHRRWRFLMHKPSEPAILYFGTPVALLSTVNEDGRPNLSPMSSVFWLGWRCVLGLDASSKTPKNMIRTGECVISLPSDGMASAVDRLARTTGCNPVPEQKVRRGYRHEPDKFGTAGLTPVPSETVRPPRVHECPVQLEATVEATHGLADGDPNLRGRVVVVETRVRRVHVEESILMAGHPNRIDPDRWRPLIMSFQQFYGLTPDKLQHSKLGRIAESLYRSPDVDRARQEALATRPVGKAA